MLQLIVLIALSLILSIVVCLLVREFKRVKRLKRDACLRYKMFKRENI